MGGRGSTSGMGQSNQYKIRKEDMPALTGSPKQIEWAENIRNEAIETANDLVQTQSKNYEKFKKLKEYSDEVQLYMAQDMASVIKQNLKSITSASKIIDIRNNISAGGIINLYNGMANSVSTQISNGMKYDRKMHRMIKP